MEFDLCYNIPVSLKQRKVNNMPGFSAKWNSGHWCVFDTEKMFRSKTND